MISLLFLLAVPCSLLPLPSHAFDSTEWHGKRELFAREAERLRTAYSNCLAKVDVPAEDVALPVETFADGSIKTIVRARKAQYFLDAGFVWAEGVVVETFRKDGVLDGRIEAANCVVDRGTRSGWAEGPATVIHGKTTFRGEGVYFSAADSYVKVIDRSEIDSEDLKFGGPRL